MMATSASRVLRSSHRGESRNVALPRGTGAIRESFATLSILLGAMMLLPGLNVFPTPGHATGIPGSTSSAEVMSSSSAESHDGPLAGLPPIRSPAHAWPARAPPSRRSDHRLAGGPRSLGPRRPPPETQARPLLCPHVDERECCGPDGFPGYRPSASSVRRQNGPTPILF